MRGQRTASRNFVLNGSGPNDSDKSAALTVDRSMARVVGDTRNSDGLDNAAVKAKYDIDLTQVPIKELEALSARVDRR